MTGQASLRERLLEVVEVRSRGMLVYLATNQEHERADYLMNGLKLATHVDGCHYSAAIGHRKPTSAYFHQVGIRVGLRPEEVLLIDNSAVNVQAASRAGWHAAIWTPASKLGEIVSKVSSQSDLGRR